MHVFGSADAADLANGREGSRNELLQQGRVRIVPWLKVSLPTDAFCFISESVHTLVCIKYHPSYLCGCRNLHRGGVGRRAAGEWQIDLLVGFTGRKLTTFQVNGSGSLKQTSWKIRLELLPLAPAPLINQPRFNSPSMNFLAAEGTKKFLPATELWIAACGTWRTRNGLLQAARCIHHTSPVACGGSHRSWERWFTLLSSLPLVSSSSSQPSEQRLKQ